MRDPLTWSLPLGRLFSTNIRIHLLFPLVVVPFILRVAFAKEPPFPVGAWIDATILMGFLWLSVLMHEFGHVFGARLAGGDASEVLLWPLGGLAYTEVPHTPRAHFITVVGGPLVNLVVCLVSVVLLYYVHPDGLRPSLDLFGAEVRTTSTQFFLQTWATGAEVPLSPFSLPVLLSQLFWTNYILSVFNLILVGFPMDAGRMLQCALWPHLGYRQATLTAVYAGFITACIVAIVALATKELLPLCLALFILTSCRHQWMVLETGGDESVFGYDFSQGYTSLERDDQRPTPRPRRQSWWQRWSQRRQAQKLQRETERRAADEHRMDSLLEKISALGIGALTDAEKRFMKQFSERYRNR